MGKFHIGPQCLTIIHLNSISLWIGQSISLWIGQSAPKSLTPLTAILKLPKCPSFDNWVRRNFSMHFPLSPLPTCCFFAVSVRFRFLQFLDAFFLCSSFVQVIIFKISWAVSNNLKGMLSLYFFFPFFCHFPFLN